MRYDLVLPLTEAGVSTYTVVLVLHPQDGVTALMEAAQAGEAGCVACLLSSSSCKPNLQAKVSSSATSCSDVLLTTSTA